MCVRACGLKLQIKDGMTTKSMARMGMKTYARNQTLDRCCLISSHLSQNVPVTVKENCHGRKRRQFSQSTSTGWLALPFVRLPVGGDTA